jgi:diphosphomevalonate decarboxylase
VTTVSAYKKTDGKQSDRLWLNGEELSVEKSPRVMTVLREMRKRATRFGDSVVHIVSANSFPTAAGLASSAAGYAALTIVLADVFAVPLNADLTTVARMGSGSACRSLYGGLVAWNAGKKTDGTDSVAVKIAPKSSWLDITILVLNAEKKHTSSTSGMVRSVDTSALLGFRAKHVVSPRIEEMSKAYKSQDFQTFGTLMMRDSNQFHATCLDTYPPVFYLTDDSRKVINFVHALNEEAGCVRAAYTFDAGPNAVIFTQSKDTESFFKDLEKFQQQHQGVIQNILKTRIGDGPRKLDKLSLIDPKTSLPKKNYSKLI